MFGAASVMYKILGPVCFRKKFSLSNFSLQMDLPPVPLWCPDYESRNHYMKGETFIFQCSEHRIFLLSLEFCLPRGQRYTAKGMAISNHVKKTKTKTKPIKNKNKKNKKHGLIMTSVSANQ